MRFQVEETMTSADWSAWIAVCASHNKFVRAGLTGAAAVQRAIGGLFVLLGGFCVLSSLPARRVDLLTILGAALILGGIFLWGRKQSTGRLLQNQYSNRLRSKIPDMNIRISFEDDAFFIWEEGKSSSCRYDGISDCWEDKDRFYLLFDGKVRFILRKNSFVQGAPADFSTFLSNKMGKAVEYIEII